MRAAVVTSAGTPPALGEFAEPELGADEVLVHVAFAARSNLVKMQAAGKHYSSGARFPFVPGVDGVGHLDDGTRVFFAFPRAPFGSMAERVPVAREYVVPLPPELDGASAAAAANPAMSSMAALRFRARFEAGESVLINGATGVSGRLAVRIAKHLGAARVVATGRNATVLAQLRELGADETIALTDDATELAARFRATLDAHPIDVVLDYLWGASAEALLGAIAATSTLSGAPRVRYVQIGSIAGASILIDAKLLRSSGLELLGSGLGSVSNTQLVAAIEAVLREWTTAGFTIGVATAPLDSIATWWNRDTGDDRLVCAI